MINMTIASAKYKEETSLSNEEYITAGGPTENNYGRYGRRGRHP